MLKHLSFRTQVLLVLVFCLGLLAAATLFLNTYLIAGLKERMKEQAIALAEEQARKAIHNMEGNIEEASTLKGEWNRQSLSQQVEILLKGNNNVMAVCVLDESGNVVVADTGNNPDMVELRQGPEGIEAEIDPSDFDSIRLRLRKKHPRMETINIPIEKKDEVRGNLLFLISESGVYRDIASAAGEISRRLWSVLLAFVAVLLLGFYLLAFLFRRQISLRARNEQLDRMAYVGTLASGLAHEIRNPLNAISMNLTLADEEIQAGEEGNPGLVQRFLSRISQETSRLNHSVTSFMQFAHPDAYRREKMELRPVVMEVLELLQPHLEEGKIRTVVDLPEDTWLEADFSGLRQVLYNVVLNGVQAMTDAGIPEESRCLLIGGRRESAQWFLWVEDDGPGIPPEKREKVFEVFETNKAAGSGFGLAIARGIIQSHGGDIRARAGEKGGARIEITLPETGRSWRQKGKT